MTQSHKLQTLLTQAKKEQWPYPKTFQALKDAGVTSYKVTFAAYDATYYGSFGTWKEPAPEGVTPQTISPTFDKSAFVDALKRHMRKETTYAQWLAQSAAAGVDHYVVSMPERTVTYYGINPDEFHVEHVPQIS